MGNRKKVRKRGENKTNGLYTQLAKELSLQGLNKLSKRSQSRLENRINTLKISIKKLY